MERRHRAFGYCDACYRRLRTKTALAAPPESWGPCGAMACSECRTSERRHRGFGLCSRCYFRRYYATPSGKTVLAECARRYRATPRGREERRESARRRRDRKARIEDVAPSGYREFVLNAFGWRCARCRNEGPLELDHHRPLVRGHGLLHNAVPLCVSCNRSKHMRRPESFYTRWELAEILMRLELTRDACEQSFASGAPAREATRGELSEC